MPGNYSQDALTGAPATDIPPVRSQSMHRSADRAPSAGSPATLVKPARLVAKLVSWACGALMAMLLCSRILNWAWGAVMSTLLSTLALGQQASMPVMPMATKPDAAILEIAEAYRKAVLDANAAGVAALFREDAVEMPPFQPPITGRTAIEQFYQGMFKGPIRVTGFTFTHVETTTHGDVAYDVGTYKRTMSGAPTAHIDAVGTYVVILKRTGGEWRVAYIIYNCDCQPPARASSAATH
jgi:uncharacterized protein (TIGR02246 family)